MVSELDDKKIESADSAQAEATSEDLTASTKVDQDVPSEVAQGVAQGVKEELGRFKFASGEGADFKWYVAHALTGHENKAVLAMKERILNHRMNDYFADILVPEESVVTNTGGKKRTIKKKFFPGYILVKMVMNESTWQLIKNTDKITGFLGGDPSKPTPISDEEALQLTSQATEGFKRPKSAPTFSEGDSVKVIEGPFASFVGIVENVSDKGKVRVQVSIFGRPTPVELDFSQVEKTS